MSAPFRQVRVMLGFSQRAHHKERATSHKLFIAMAATSSRRSQSSEMPLYSRLTRTLEMRGSPCGASLLMCVDIDDDILDVGHGHGRRAV
jgi:hypothetical protein